MTKKRFKKNLMAAGVSRNVAERVSVAVSNSKGHLSYDEHYARLRLDIWERVTRLLRLPTVSWSGVGHIKPYINPNITEIDEVSHLMMYRSLGQPVLSSGFAIVTCKKSESD